MSGSGTGRGRGYKSPYASRDDFLTALVSGEYRRSVDRRATTSILRPAVGYDSAGNIAASFSPAPRIAAMPSSYEHDSDSDSDITRARHGKGKATPAESATSSELVQPEDVGMTIECKQLYSGKEDKRGRFQWQTEIPKDVGKPAENEESKKYAIVVRRIKVYNDPQNTLTIHSLLIQSPILKEFLEDVLAGYPGITVGLKRLEFSGRFEPLIHRWPAIREEMQNTLTKLRLTIPPDQALQTRHHHATLLNNLLIEEFTEINESMKEMKEHGVVTYEHLWTIFQPNSLIYSKQDNQDRALRLASSKYGVDRNNNPVFWLTCVYIDYDGTQFGTQKLNISISQFEGTRPVNSLNAFPFEFHAETDELRTKLLERGSKIEALAGSHFRNYNGIGWRFGAYGSKDKTTVRGRIVIDTFGFNRFNPDHAVYVTPLSKDDPGSIGKFGKGKARHHHSRNAIVAGGYGGYATDPNLILDLDDGGMPADGFFDDESDDNNKRPSLTDDQKLIASPLVRGYALKEKIWLNLFVNAVHDISFNQGAFEALNLPNNQKELILGFTSTKQAYRSQFDDFIEGKGRGIIILLSGPPGVGKTLTAESVAENMKVPLYQMAAGDLGLDPRSVETKLQGVLDMCSRWNAILLLDEADVFLEQRSMHELERNKLVSIFLRVLEYYQGIMFLTTNRVETFDPAFQSRIHISLEYPELDYKSRKGIWETFLKQHNAAQQAAREKPAKALPGVAKYQAVDGESGESDGAGEKEKELQVKLTQPHALSEGDIRKLAQIKLNGRQIKNFLKTAQLLANHREEALKFEHVETVVKTTQHLHKATQASEEAKAGIFN